MNETLSNPIIIALISFIATTILTPLVKRLYTYLATLKKPFTGYYLVINRDYNSSNSIIEYANLKQTNNNIVKGKLFGLYVAEDDGNEYSIISEHKGKYVFRGNIEERLMTLSYNSIAKGVFSSGTMTIKADYSANIISGIWSGLENEKVVSSKCVWIKTSKDVLFSQDEKKRKEYVISILESVQTENNPFVQLLREYVAQKEYYFSNNLSYRLQSSLFHHVSSEYLNFNSRSTYKSIFSPEDNLKFKFEENLENFLIRRLSELMEKKLQDESVKKSLGEAKDENENTNANNG